jgi:hypothetical protein
MVSTDREWHHRVETRPSGLMVTSGFRGRIRRAKTAWAGGAEAPISHPALGEGDAHSSGKPARRKPAAAVFS